MLYSIISSEYCEHVYYLYYVIRVAPITLSHYEACPSPRIADISRFISPERSGTSSPRDLLMSMAYNFAVSIAKDPWKFDNLLHGFVLRQQPYNLPVD